MLKLESSNIMFEQNELLVKKKSYLKVVVHFAILGIAVVFAPVSNNCKVRFTLTSILSIGVFIGLAYF